MGDSFNDTVNGKTSRSIVADPDSTEVNQAFVRYDADDDLEFRFGRQEISLGNDRFIGAVPWRQNHQSFDGARALYDVHEDLRVDYSVVFQVNRIFGEESAIGDEALQAHFLDARYDAGGYGEYAAYVHLIDFEDTLALSSQTAGLRGNNDHVVGEVSGQELQLGWTAEFAVQEDAGDNPIDIDQDYLFLEGRAKLAGYTLSIASETLGGSGDAGDKFSTPFATLHKFNGFADVFLNTPDAGLEDQYIKLSKAFDLGFLDDPVKFSVVYHQFSADAGGQDFGTELDFNMLAPLSKRSSLGFRFADFQGENGFQDVQRFMIWLNYRLL